ncbi:FAD-dependent oxidoreductase [Alteromonas aestuariivivens]|uniref:FAD-dependent oxidoreductase n=1 Tax=Alteromonas aestuariivivens TaxID=1938339 RepID=A0A3D8M4N1_9ALTE|nr:FAD-dependent oxidoreductase [Alteromonas aestuariivivens]RDV24568.1 FAD-dependent oxidoreductase [Alteromonas aestuariivivens]
MFDFCIVGAGMVGSSLALGLVQQGYQVALIEAEPPVPFEPQQPPDLRVSAISMASVDLLSALGAWPHIMAMRTRAYSRLSVWEGQNSRADFCADEVGMARLGYFVENRLLQLGCHQALAGYKNLTWFRQSQIQYLNPQVNQGNRVGLSDGEIEARWVIGADGARSKVRQLSNIGTSGWQYGQQAMGITVGFDSPVADWTWQQFLPSGPRALLPMHDNFASLIWYDAAARIKALSMLSSDKLKSEIVREFPPLEGDFEVLGKAAFALTRSHASRYVVPGTILIGDAAHTINPLAGQGVNLGFRDVEALLSATASAPDLLSDDFFDLLKEKYEKPRRRDNLLMMSAMDGFYWLFGNEHRPLTWLRKGLLKMAQHGGPAKRKVLKYAMGMDKWKF